MISAFLFTTWSMKPGPGGRSRCGPGARRGSESRIVERRDRPPPRDLCADLQPLGVLVEHRVDDVDERLVAVEEPVPPGQQVALEPALAEVLAQDLHDAAVGREMVVGPAALGLPRPVGGLEHRAQAVRGGLVGAEEAEVRRARVTPASRRAGSRRARAWPRWCPSPAPARRPRSRGSPGSSRSRVSKPPLACGIAPMRRAPSGASAASSARSAPPSSNSSSGR